MSVFYLFTPDKQVCERERSYRLTFNVKCRTIIGCWLYVDLQGCWRTWTSELFKTMYSLAEVHGARIDLMTAEYLDLCTWNAPIIHPRHGINWCVTIRSPVCRTSNAIFHISIATGQAQVTLTLLSVNFYIISHFDILISLWDSERGLIVGVPQAVNTNLFNFRRGCKNQQPHDVKVPRERFEKSY